MSETVTTRLQQISSKTVNTKEGPALIYEFTLDGFDKPFSTFRKELADPFMQGKMVNVEYTIKEKPWGPTPEGRSGTYKNFYVESIQVAEGDTGTLDDVLTGGVAQQQTVGAGNAGTYMPSAVESGPVATPAPPSATNGHEDTRQRDIRRAVALKAAVDIAAGMLAAGNAVNDDYITSLAAKFEPYLEGR